VAVGVVDGIINVKLVFFEGSDILFAMVLVAIRFNVFFSLPFRGGKRSCALDVSARSPGFRPTNNAYSFSDFLVKRLYIEIDDGCVLLFFTLV
jgi:hypothetical protein